MRTLLFVPLLFLHVATFACTAFKASHNGRTFIGCNEDSWSINANVRFEQGRDGGYGTLYFANYNGHPTRAMADQLGMNEAGLVFDGLSIQPQQATPVPGKQQVRFDDLMPMLMRTCATVHEAATRLRTYDFSWLTRSMLFFADRNGDYLIVENDTMILGHDPSYAVGNWRMGNCSDPATIPIPRLQAGRELLLSGNGASFEEAEKVLSTMTVCRPKMGEGTLFSVLFDPQEAQAHLYFYHDFSERFTFDLKEELAKGDRRVDMASLFGARPEYDRLKNYLTPFHQRWLWWAMAMFGVVALMAGFWAIGLFVAWLIASIRGRSLRTGLPWSVMGTGAALTLFLVAMLLMVEGVYYFGLGTAVDDMHPLLRWAPLALMVCTGWMLIRSHTGARLRVPLRVLAGTQLVLLGCLLYWGMLWP
jgi:hypothetical protein